MDSPDLRRRETPHLPDIIVADFAELAVPENQ
jgi:hypothetical protein